jgi:hypothetical protein
MQFSGISHGGFVTGWQYFLQPNANAPGRFRAFFLLLWKQMK